MSVKKIMAIFIALSLIILNPFTTHAQDLPYITAQAAIVMDVESGCIVYSKNANKRMYPASTTKILTSIMALEMGKLEDVVQISAESAQVGEASIYLYPGHKIKLINLIKGALIKSGNDAAHALGEYVAGDESLFVYLMNKKAILLGSEMSNFCNTNGLPDDNHITSAKDLAFIARYAMHNKEFAEIVNTKQDVIEFIDGEKRYLKNTNKLLWKYSYADGIKTGTTRKAGNCLVASATKDGRQFLAVILKSYDRYGDAKKLFQYAFNNFEIYFRSKNTSFGRVSVKNGDKVNTELIIPHDIAAICDKNNMDGLQIKPEVPRYIEAPLFRGKKVGKVEIILNGKTVDTAPLIVTEDIVAKSWIKRIQNWFTNTLPQVIKILH
ncbi:MAG: hypothetical protein PWQ96_601 [Clostridia bacterium]|jgi:D-alanyl-D-alanine carboxypeptidase (penicillin-binding protein 5/6)|nr:hypothetical protein [Clostridia bacterium]